MSKQYPGGLITKTPVVPSGPFGNDTASGIWTLDQQAYWAKLGQWPTAGNFPRDAQFNYVTMLLHGDGTNGAQNNTFLDTSGNSYTITRNGNTTQGSFSPYGSNWSNYFPGATNLFLATATALGTGNVTVEFWFNAPDISANYYGLYDGRSSAGTNTGFGVFQYGQTIEIYGNGLKVSTAASAFSVNTWTHFAVVRTAGTCQIYINGVASGSSASYSDNFTSTTRTIGSNVSTANVYVGYISNLREVTSALYSGTFTPSTTPLTAVSGTTLLTCQSNRYIDNSSNAYAVTASIAFPTVQRFNPFGTATAYSTAVIGGSAYFDGTGDFLSSVATTGLSTSDYTMEMWVYPTSLSAAYVPFSYGWSTTTSPRQIVFVQNTNATYQIYYNDASYTFVTSNTVKLNAWNHLALVRNGNTFSFYINGVPGATSSNTITYGVSSYPITIGSSWNSSTSTGDFNYFGYISDFRISIGTAVYTSAFTPPTAPLTASTTPLLLLNMTNGAIFDNAMMNDLETVGNAQISTSVYKYGTGSLYFDGTGDYLSTRSTPNLSFGSGDFTIECWVYASSLGSYNAVVAQWPDNGGSVNNQYTLETVGSNMEFYVCSGTTVYGPTTLGTITTGVWIHYAVCRSGNTLYPFKNGVLGTTTSLTQTLNSPTSAITVGGQVAGAGYWNGYIDDLRLTKGYARYTATFTPPTEAFLNIGPN